MENTYKLKKSIEKDGKTIEKLNVDFKKVSYKTFDSVKNSFIKKNKEFANSREREILIERDFIMFLIAKINEINVEELENALNSKTYLRLYMNCVANFGELLGNPDIEDNKYKLDYDIILNDNYTTTINLDYDELSVGDLKQVDKEFKIRKIDVGNMTKEFSSTYAMMIFAKVNNCVLEDFQEQLSVIDYLNITEYYNSQSLEDDEEEGND